MKQKIFNAFMFATGATIGSLVTWKVVKTKYERLMQEEIDAFKKEWPLYMQDKSSEGDSCVDEWDDCEDDDEDDCDGDGDIINYRMLAANYNCGEGGKEEEVPYVNGPYVIAPEDFGDGNYDHDAVALVYYADGVLADDWGCEVDIEETIGEDALNHFGEYDDDVVHVRNERTCADYEVVRDPRRYTDAITINPPMNGYET